MYSPGTKMLERGLVTIGLAFPNRGQHQLLPVIDLPSGAVAARLRRAPRLGGMPSSPPRWVPDTDPPRQTISRGERRKKAGLRPQRHLWCVVGIHVHHGIGKNRTCMRRRGVCGPTLPSEAATRECRSSHGNLKSAKRQEYDSEIDY